MQKVEFREIKDGQRSLVQEYRLNKEGGSWVLTLARGECRTAGYDILLKSVTVDNGIVTALVGLINPPPQSFCAMVITFPSRQYVLNLPGEPEKVIIQSEDGQILKSIDL